VRPVVVSHTGVAGGSNDVILGLLRNRPADVEPLCVFLDDGPALRSVRDLGIEARVVEAGRTRDVWRVPAVIGRLAGVMRRAGVDVVFAHASKAQVYASPAASLVGVPNMWYQHEVPGFNRAAPGMTRVLQEVAARLPAYAVVCNSDFVAGEHSERWPGARVRRVHPGVQTAGVRARIHRAAGDACFVVVGRLQRWKRVELALEAMRLVLARQPRARLKILGDARPDVDADYPAELRARAAALGMAHAVHFASAVADVDEQLASADVMLHLADREAYGLVLVEALLRGIPVISPPRGGGAEIVRDGVDGLLVDPVDTPALADALVGLAENPQRRAAMGAAGRARALECFDERRTAAETWQLLRDAARPIPSRSRRRSGR
jgi:glycosyltransferase involved in cell wall biosynthesis